MSVVLSVLSLIGALGLFLFGMTMMSEALQKVAGDKLRNILNAMTSNPLKRILTGAGITAIIQSSSATTVMVVSFVSAGLLSLTQSVGVIMGANIGTTVTAWLIALLGFKADISIISLPLIGVGFFFMMMKRQKKKNIGELIIGFALLFLGLSLMKTFVPDINSHPEALAVVTRWTGWGFWSILTFVGIGTLLTIILQSSSATMALTLVMCNFGWIPFEMAAAMVLGENIGTTITANIAASVASTNAKRAARAHSIFNLFGVFWVLILFHPFLLLVSKIIVGLGGMDPFDMEIIRATGKTETLLYSVAMVHTLFNVINSGLLVGFTPLIVKIVKWLVKNKPDDEMVRLKFIEGGILSTAELSLSQAAKEIEHFTRIVKKQFIYASECYDLVDDDKKFEPLFNKVEKYEEITDNIELEIAKYLQHISETPLSKESSNRIQSMYTIINELESIGDSNYNIVRILNRMNAHHEKFTEDRQQKLIKMSNLVLRDINVMIENVSLGYSKIKDINNAKTIEKSINEYRNILKEDHMNNISTDENLYMKGIYYMDLITEYERIGDYLINISEAIEELMNRKD
ncbi:MAG: Na/Pi cotransporter family protein [Bacteroidales bacterium]